MSSKLDPFKHMPGTAKQACEMLSALSGIWGVFTILGLVISAQIGFDAVRAGLVIYTGILSTGALTATILLAKGKRAGKIIAIIVLPFFVIFIPIGTIIGVMAAIGLQSSDMKGYLAGHTCPQ